MLPIFRKLAKSKDSVTAIQYTLIAALVATTAGCAYNHYGPNSAYEAPAYYQPSSGGALYPSQERFRNY